VLLPPVSGRQYASAELGAEQRVVSQSGQIEVGGQGFVVRQLFDLSALNLAIDKEWTDTDRPIWSSHLLRVYSGESSVRPSSRQTSPTLSQQKAGDHFISTSRSVSPFSSAWMSCWW
jgi:hypothetical protein